MGRYNDAGLTDFNWSADPNRGYSPMSDPWGTGPSYRGEVMSDIAGMRGSGPWQNSGYYGGGGGGGSYAGGGGLPSYMDDDAINYYEKMGIQSMAGVNANPMGSHSNLSAYPFQPRQQGQYGAGVNPSSIAFDPSSLAMPFFSYGMY